MDDCTIDEMIRWLDISENLLLSPPALTRQAQRYNLISRWLKELKQARDECARQILIKCKCGYAYERGKAFLHRESFEPFSQASVNINWTCKGCGHSISTGPVWGEGRDRIDCGCGPFSTCGTCISASQKGKRDEEQR